MELLRAADTSEQVQQDAAVVLHELDSLARISSQLLLVTATELAELVEPVRMDMAVLLERVASRWRPTADRRWTLDVEPSPLVADEALLESALDALIENALKYTTDGGSIVLCCRPLHGGVRVSVEDDGCGISAFVMKDVFERSSRLGPAAARGTGLGLSIVKAITEAHHGALEVTSQVRRGATFVLTLPDVAPALSPARPRF